MRKGKDTKFTHSICENIKAHKMDSDETGIISLLLKIDRSKDDTLQSNRSKEDVLKIINLIDNKDTAPIESIRIVDERIRNNAFSLLEIYIYLHSARNGKFTFDFEILDNVINYLASLKFELDEVYCEIFIRILKCLFDLVRNNMCEVFIIKKIFYMTFPLMYKRRKFIREVKLRAYNLMVEILVTTDKFSLHDIIQEYDSIDDFCIHKVSFRQYVFIDSVIRFIKAEKKIGKVHNFMISMLRDNKTTSIVLNTCDLPQPSLENSDFLYYTSLMAFIFIEESIDICKVVCQVFTSIFLSFQKDGSSTELVSDLLHHYSYGTIDKFIVRILLSCLSGIKQNESKHYSVFKVILSLDVRFLSENERNSLLQHLVRFYNKQHCQSKEIILKILVRLKYSRFFDIIQSDIASESIKLRKNIFECSKSIVDSKERIVDFVRIFLNFITSDSMRKYVLANFNFSQLFSNIENKNEIPTYSALFIDTLSKYVYFYDDKSFIQNIKIRAVHFIPYKEDIFRIKYLKHLAIYEKDDLIDLQSELISLIRINNASGVFIDDILSILILISGDLTDLSQIQILDIAERLSKYEICARKLGLLLKRLSHHNLSDFISSQKSLLYSFINPDDFIKGLNPTVELWDTVEIRCFLYNIEENKNLVKKYDKNIQEIANQLLSTQFATTNNGIIVLYDFLNHILYMTNNEYEKEPFADFYQMTVIFNIKNFLGLVLHRQRSICVKTYRLIMRFLNRGYILPHSCISELICFNTVYFNPSFNDLIILYSTEIINQLDVIQKRITNCFLTDKISIRKENLSFSIIYNSLKTETKKYTFLLKCLSIIDNMSMFSIYFILRNFLHFDLSKKHKSMILAHLTRVFDDCQIIYGVNENINILLKHLIFCFKNSLKKKVEFEVKIEYFYENDDSKKLIRELNQI